MKEKMGSEETNVPSKPSRRRASHQAHSEETAHAWPLHRSPSPPPCVTVTEKETIVKGNNNSNNEIHVSMSLDAQYCYYMLETMPQPGPTWSTTGPSVLAQPTPTQSTLSIEASQDSSCTWWLGYLEGLDGIMTTEKLDPLFEENVSMENSKGFNYESTFVDAIDLSYCCPDDWLVIPTMEQDLGDMVMP